MEDLDIPQLAEYLHITPDQVRKMATRGNLPGRRVGGDWRFNEAEIHHWLEERIGLSDQGELDQVRAVLHRQSDAPPQNLSELCPVDLIANPFVGRTRGSVIRNMCELASRTGMLWDAPAMAEAVASREKLHPTALDCGVALLHPRRPQTSILAESVVALGVCPTAVPFSDTGQLTDIFFLICSYDDSSHLRILAKLSRIVSDEAFLEGVRASDTPADTWALLNEAEMSLDEHHAF
ncbi:PTS sugar transporter subunit IIA [Rhodopirellula sp. JC740]|uniref:PTS sugar transporter subunit IIA n=1 Tax=Rhodopirellula halodulae TaxID=2894198 RepID=A0ABS8NIX4_9BACT|nr:MULTISPECIES: PTS sugar transporter subunit IIA [unclassified Rhodopirellula]MCC9643504.1 PTS sugar transporter subunit IIA [Rhodopirellula sp. JC740]MCC9658104.1 PTS sugar transporter subunit IIA [Rhodopirellula sp. JC737]